MSTPPIENPTPFTCAHCGVGLVQRADFCPHCGARLELAQPRSAGWIVGTLALGLVTLGFGAIGACSAYVSGTVIFMGQGDYLGSAFLMFALPLLLVGAVGAYFCGRALLRRWRD